MVDILELMLQARSKGNERKKGSVKLRKSLGIVTLYYCVTAKVKNLPHVKHGTTEQKPSVKYITSMEDIQNLRRREGR